MENTETRKTEKTARFRRNPDFILREVAGEYILVPTGNTAAHFSGMGAMNQTAAFLWKHLEQERTPEELAGLLADEYELMEEQSLQDVKDFLEAAQTRSAVLRS